MGAHVKRLLAISSVPPWLIPDSWDKSHAGTPLDLTGATQTFLDEFTTLDVTADDGAGPWYAPSRSSYGVSTFQAPSTPNIFLQSGSELTVRSRWSGSKWLSGHMQTMNTKGVGWSQALGYFEARMRMDRAGVGAWPAFWLKSINSITDKVSPYAELDVYEGYSGSPNNVRTTWHRWRQPEPPAHVGLGNTASAGTSIFTGAYRRFGLEVTPDWIIAYFDRVETARYAAYAEAKLPLFMMVSNAMYTLPPDHADIDLVVDYVAAWSRS